MTVIELVARERSRMGRVVALRGGAVAVAAVAVVLALGALALGGGRWMALPAVLPFLAWGLAAAVLTVLAWITLRQLRRDTATTRIATAIEHERRLRAGSLRGALEVAETGALGPRGSRPDSPGGPRWRPRCAAARSAARRPLPVLPSSPRLPLARPH